MTDQRSCAYIGAVVHKRLSPGRHAFRYRVFVLCLDVDEIDAVASRTRLFSRNQWNLVSFHDRDHGAGTDAMIGEHARRLLAGAGLGRYGSSLSLVCYPRILGYVFNPLSVYFCRDREGTLGAIIYEVSNTQRERRSYVIAVDGAEAGGVLSQHCAKELYVSPFTALAGQYGFHVIAPGERVVIGVAFREDGKPVLKTHFSGERRMLDDWALMRLLIGCPLLTLKVTAAIHLEALRLWLKGVPVQAYRPSERFSVTHVNSESRKARHV